MMSSLAWLLDYFSANRCSCTCRFHPAKAVPVLARRHIFKRDMDFSRVCKGHGTFPGMSPGSGASPALPGTVSGSMAYRLHALTVSRYGFGSIPTTTALKYFYRPHLHSKSQNTFSAYIFVSSGWCVSCVLPFRLVVS